MRSATLARGLALLPPARRLAARRRRWIAAAAVLAAAALGYVVDDLALLSTFTLVLVFIVISEAWNVLGGYGGYFNLGMAAFYGIGAYTTGLAYNYFAISPFLSAPAGGVAAAVFALAIGLPSLRLRGPYFAILTLILTFMLQVLVFSLKFTRGALGILIRPLDVDPQVAEQIFYYVFLALALLSIVIAYLVEHSRFGDALVAIREDEDAAEMLGVRTTRVKILALLIGAGLTGLAGGIYAYKLSYIEPLGVFNVDISIDPVLMSTVGGSGTWIGPVIGVPVVLLVAQLLRTGVAQVGLFGHGVPNEFNRVVFGLILILLGLFARRGIAGLFRRARGRQTTT